MGNDDATVAVIAAEHRFKNFLDLLPGDVIVRKHDIISLMERLPSDETTRHVAHKFFVELIRQNLYRLIEALPDHDIVAAYTRVVSYAKEEQLVQENASKWAVLAGVNEKMTKTNGASENDELIKGKKTHG